MCWVNLFILVSGYFSIHHTLKPILRLIVDLVIYNTIAYIIATILFGIDFSFIGIVKSIDIHNWFVLNYAILVLVAPMLELYFKNLDRKAIGKSCIVLLIVNVIFGWFWGVVNDNGYNYINFIFLYFIARYIRLTNETSSLLTYKHIQKYGMIYWAISAILLVLAYLALVMYHKTPESTRWFGYNNPLVIFSSVCLYVFIISKKFYSKWINLFATGIFGVFLLHTPPVIQPIRNNFAHHIFINNGYIGIIVLALILLIVLTCISIFIEKINKTIVTYIDAFLCKYQKRLSLILSLYKNPSRNFREGFLYREYVSFILPKARVH